MALQSDLFKGDQALEACLVSDPAHITTGAVGGHVSKVHAALLRVEATNIDEGERAAARYGPSTAAAVLAFKKKRQIINKAYQTKPDDIVGKMTIAALDKDVLEWEQRVTTCKLPERAARPMLAFLGHQGRAGTKRRLLHDLIPTGKYAERARSLGPQVGPQVTARARTVEQTCRGEPSRMYFRRTSGSAVMHRSGR